MPNKSILQLFIFAILICIASSQQNAFTATLKISKDPVVGEGSVITIKPIYYDPKNLRMRLDYPNLQDNMGKTGFTEIYNYNSVIFQAPLIII